MVDEDRAFGPAPQSRAPVSQRSTEEQINLALEVGRLGIWSLDLATWRLTVSDTCKLNYGRGAADSLTYDELRASIVEQDAPLFERTVRNAIDGRCSFEMEYGIRWPDGSLHWVLVRGRCRTDAAGNALGMLGVSADITEQKLAREVLHDTQSRLEATLAAGEVGTWTWNLRDDRVVADRNLARLFGVSEANAQGGPIAAYLEAIHPEDRERTEALIRRAIEQNERYETKYRVRDADGAYRTVVARGQAEYAADGTPLRLPGVVIDVTREERAAAELHESQARYRSLFEAIDDGFCIIERIEDVQEPGKAVDFRYIEANPAFAVHSGVSGVVGRTIRSLALDGVDGSIAIYDRVLRTGEAHRFERLLGTSDRVLDVYALPVPGSPRPRVAVIFKDISARKKVERTLRASEERVRSVLEATGAGTWEVDPVTESVSGDAELRTLHRYPEHGPIPLANGFDFIHPGDLDRVRASAFAAMRGEDGGRYHTEYRIVLPDGGSRWLEVRGLASFDAAERLTRFTGTAVDITGRKQAEAEREELYARTLAAQADAEAERAKVEQAGIVERQLRRDAEQANRAKDEFLAMLGHELRNPLAPITTALQLMKLRSEHGFEKERTMIERQVDHLTRLVDDLLDVSRITSGKIAIDRALVNLAPIVASAIELASPVIEQRQHHLHVEVPAHGLLVQGDALRLAQVIANLLNNAAKYTEGSGGRIEVSAKREGSEIVLLVKDNGVGIAPEMLPRIFDLFVQERQAIDRARGGLGLGLTIVRTLIELHGGSVSAKSEGHGTGSEFTLRLPRASEPDGKSDPRAAAIAPPRKKADSRRILVVDDNTDAAELLANALEFLGHETRTAHDGPSALAEVRHFTPDLAVLDIGLPVMDGYELGRRLREIPHLSALRLIALTGYGQASDRKRSADAGFDFHMVKPVELSQLEAIIDSSPKTPSER